MSPRWFDEDSDTVTGLLRRRVAEHHELLFLDIDGTSHSYGQTWERSRRLASALANVGVGRNDTVVSMQDTHFDAVTSWFGANMLGAIWVGINTALKGEFLRHVVTDTGARVVICEPEFLPRFAALGQTALAVDVFLCPGVGVVVRPDGLDARPLELPDPLAESSIVDVVADDLTCLTYTGGTTGPSKGCMISHAYALNLARKGLLQTGRRRDEVNWNPLPMYHLNVLAMSIVGSMLVGGSAALSPRFSVSRFWPEIERTGANVVNLIGAMPVMLAQQPDTPASQRCHGQIRMLHSVPFPPSLQQLWRTRFGVETPGATGYGMTEAFPISYLAAGEHGPAGSAGRPSEEFEVRIVDDHDVDVPTGAVGEIVCRPRRANVMFKGYWRRPEAMVEATRNLWFHTGDLGRFDDDGYVWFVDRKHDYLRRRGENISSQELESTYLSHPSIEQVAVHAVPSPLAEDDVKVTAVLAHGTDLTPSELFAWSLERVPYFALPRYIEFRDELPLSPLGRVHKYKLRDEGCTETTWDRDLAGVDWERR